MTERPPGPRKLRRIGLLLGGLALSLLALEFGLRAAGYQARTPRWFDPELGWRFYPDQLVSMRAGGVDLGRATIDAHGYRAPAHDPPRAAGALSIAAVGDSVTFGWPVADDETWPAQLEARLARQLDGRAVAVRNFGVPGWNTSNEERQYPLHVQPWGPDVVLLGFSLNDTQLEDRGPRNSGGPLFSLLRDTALLTAFHQHLRPHVSYFDVDPEPAELAQLRMSYRDQRGQIMLTPKGPGEPYWDRVDQTLRRFVARVRADDVKLGLVVFPDHLQIDALRAEGSGLERLDGKGAWASGPQRHLAKLCAELELPMLDLLPPFVGMQRAPFHEQDEGHPSAAGYELTAHQIAAWLRRLGWTQAP
ncbi:MAG: hypothetical protein DRQ55_14855 [Planctomycetota bacterium]|nr:MAG: hypothetical protein DRQ55_14855 [Planctomycetota bacterium]